ncbi:MAG: hypothetical protein ACRC1I_20050, partial [Pseudomonas proteolytica]|uniref:hypothetical protein n=1 Tax=Pseudomonas proteolytica TaxID=219574 RepID=UPI003F2A7058
SWQPLPFTSYFLVQEIMEIHDLIEEKCSFKTLVEKMAQICGTVGAGLPAIATYKATTLLSQHQAQCSQIFLFRPFDEFFQSKATGCARVYELPFSQMNINVRIQI